jgi:Domain of unknown function (DUF4838)/Beta-galactosidase second all-beta domain
MRRTCVQAAILCSLLILALTSAADVVLVDHGNPVASIVIGDSASAQAQEAANDLQHYLHAISGGRLPIVRESEPVDGSRILVGRSEAVEALGVELPSGHTPQMNEEAAVIKTVGRDLILAGNEDWNYRGTVIAVYTLLHDLGCRWYFPGEFGEVLPNVPTVAVRDQDRIERPSFRIRHLWYSGWSPVTDEDNARFQAWYKHNRLNSLAFNLPGDGSIDRLRPDALFDTRPELFALDKDGKPTPNLLNLSSDEAVAIAADTTKAHFRDNPDALTFGFAPHDGFPVDHRPESMQLMPEFMGKGYGDPSVSSLWFQFANRIAREVYKEFPERWVLTNGYANRVRFPEGVGELSPNLGIQSAIIAADTLHRIGDPTSWQRLLYKQVLDRWTDEIDLVVIYDYDPGNALDNLPFPALHCLRHDLPYFHGRGVWGFYTEGNNAWMVTHLNYYVRAQLMWDVTEDVDALVREYCELFYGPAADAVENYIWTLEKAVDSTPISETWGRLMPWRLVLADVRDDLDRLMAHIETAAADATSDIQKRIRLLRTVHDHMNGYLAMEDATVEGAFSKAVTHIERMLALRDQADAIEPGMVPHTPESYADFRTTMEWHRTMYASLAARMDGTEGLLVTLLPQTWQFRTDPEDIGVFYQWYEGTLDDEWTPIDTTMPWEWQGHADEKGWGYWGKAWYRTTFDLDAAHLDKPVWLTVGAVYNRGVWVWVNGQLMPWEKNRHWRLGHHDVRTPIHIDISSVARPGQNDVAVLVNTPPPGRNPRSGLHRRSFVWTPREK